MKTYKEDSYYFLGGNISKKPFSEIIKTSYNKISIKEGKIIAWGGRLAEVTDDTVGQLTEGQVLNNSGGGDSIRIPPITDYELTKSCAVYVKIFFLAGGRWDSLIDVGYEDGSPDYTAYNTLGLLSKKHYSFYLGSFSPGEPPSYEILETEPEDYEPEDNESNVGYFYIKIADIELENRKFRIKQRHRGIIHLSEPQVYFGAYDLVNQIP